jgi:hypothetical protein
LPQDRSVVARHLQHLAPAHVVTADKQGRHVFYEIDARAVAERLEGILAITRVLESAKMAADRASTARAKPARAHT